MIARLFARLRRSPAVPMPSLFDLWAAEFDCAPNSPREQELWLALNLQSVERRAL